MPISFLVSLLVTNLVVASAQQQTCPDYSKFSTAKNGPLSRGKYALASQRPGVQCRTFTSQAVEDTITRVKGVIADPDLSRLFENSFPNTLDTAIKWKGKANGTDEELTFMITGDINAMWLRDSANQMQSYLSLLTTDTSENSIASLYRGLINLQARYITSAPYCNSFMPPEEAGIAYKPNQGAIDDHVLPDYDRTLVFECKYELDSLAAFLQASSEYYSVTKDGAFFGKYNWISAVRSILKVTSDMMTPTYGPDGSVLHSPYSWTRETTSGSETLCNGGVGNPVQNGTGLIRSAFRPSDDSTIFQLFIPANMMLSRWLIAAADIMAQLPNQAALTTQMRNLGNSISDAIAKYGVMDHPVYGRVYAYEVDGFGSANLMDDANIPSLLASPMFGFTSMTDPIYQNTRKMVLGNSNSYFMHGPAINAVGSPHTGPGQAWPMASIARILTTDDDAEITSTLKEILSSTAGFGLIHESVNSFNSSVWTRQWFSWANGLFGQMILDLETRKPNILQQSFQ